MLGIYEFGIPLALLIVPWLVVRFLFVTPHSRSVSYKASLPFLATAAAIWVLAVFSPDLTIAGPTKDTSTDTFGMHTLGGVVAAIVFWYVAWAYRVRFTYWWQELVFLYLFASGLGVLNELFELLLYESGLLTDWGEDTWWDLTANTLGALIALFMVSIFRLRRK